MLVSGVVFAGLAIACGGQAGDAQLSLQWVRDDTGVVPVAPNESVKSVLVVENAGDRDLDDVTLRFEQSELARLPFGVTVGTVTNTSSRFEGESQVWDLGSIDAGDAVRFPMTLWFDSSSRTSGPITVTLVMVADSPVLAGHVESNDFEVVIESGQAVGP